MHPLSAKLGLAYAYDNPFCILLLIIRIMICVYKLDEFGFGSAHTDAQFQKLLGTIIEQPCTRPFPTASVLTASISSAFSSMLINLGGSFQPRLPDILKI